MLPPTLTAHLLPKIEALLHELLASLTADEWERQTIAPKWKVKDVAAHLLDTQLRKLSIVRDGYLPPAPPITDLAAFINQLNQDGVLLYRWLSPRVLILLMDMASRESAEFHASLDPYLRAAFNVSWAGGEDVPAQLVRYSARVYRAMAPPAADPSGRRSAWHYDSGVVSSSARLLSACLALPVPGRAGRNWNGPGIRSQR